MPANRVIASRYERTVPLTTRARSASSKPLARAAITKLADRRLTSHSQGPGRVSSKSLMSNISSRSGEASSRKFSRCASPHSWAVMPESGLPARSEAMIAAAPR